MSLEDLLVEGGVVERAALDRAVARSRELETALARILVEDGVIAEDVLADEVARAVGTVVIDIEQGELDMELVQLVPGAVARRFLLLPIMPDPGGDSLRVAFADPLDDAAVRAVRDLTGYAVQPLVATVSGVLGAIDRFHGRDTRVIRTARPEAPRSEMPAEVTRRVDAPRRLAPGEGRAAPGTSPLHRMEHEATMEQKHEALLLALIEAGVITRADYIEALRRLLGHE